MNQLHSYRDQLFDLTKTILNLIKEREVLVEKIQKEKELTDNEASLFKNFDPKREALIFSELKKQLSNLTSKELLALSLLIESQANYSEGYPCWSDLVHLDKKAGSIAEQTNPILLATVDKNSYDALPLKNEFKSILDECLERK